MPEQEHKNTTKKTVVGILIILVVIALIFIVWKQMSDNSANTAVMIESHEAITTVQVANPELLSFPSEDLPPKTIEAEAGPDGWYIGFITNGSGRPGVLEAICYFVSSKKEVTLMGNFKAGMDAPATLNLATCKPQ